jgi:hypothetical protein
MQNNHPGGPYFVANPQYLANSSKSTVDFSPLGCPSRSLVEQEGVGWKCVVVLY